MSDLQRIIEKAYEQAKAGEWASLLSEWSEFPVLGRRCSRYQKASSAWTFLHQAAYFGHAQACRDLIGFGADAGTLSIEGKTAADVSTDKGHSALAAFLQQAVLDRDSLWAPSGDPDVRPSSNFWQEAKKHRSAESILVAYGGAVIRIPNGSRHFVDSLGRVLIGWHGTFDPPRGMDDSSMLCASRS